LTRGRFALARQGVEGKLLRVEGGAHCRHPVCGVKDSHQWSGHLAAAALEEACTAGQPGVAFGHDSGR